MVYHKLNQELINQFLIEGKIAADKWERNVHSFTHMSGWLQESVRGLWYTNVEPMLFSMLDILYVKNGGNSIWDQLAECQQTRQVAGQMLDHHLRRWSNIKPVQVQRF